ncbi:rRNA methylase, TrmH family [[Synechococcus] sp. NIES-970]|nr:rRNA methylase, TrmH family [[Synechococcus] sp. NIES-970]
MLTSLQNPLVKEIRRLHQGKERQRQGLLLLEGTNLIEAAIAKGLSFQTVLFTEAWQNRYPQLAAQLPGDRRILVSAEVLQKVATTVNPDGIVATLAQELVCQTPPAMIDLGVAIERLQDPGNLGTIIRTVTAAKGEALLLSGDSVNPSNPKVLRASAGAWFQTTPMVTSSFVSQIQHYRIQGVQVIATLPQATKTYWEIDWRQPSLILLGNEGAGLSPDVAALADEAVQIPMGPGVESLNVAIACGLMLYEARRQRDCQTP